MRIELQENQISFMLERIGYEIQAKQSILYFLQIGNLADSEIYKKNYDEYLNFLKVQDIIKNEFYQQNILPYLTEKDFGKTWTVNFNQGEIIIT